MADFSNLSPENAAALTSFLDGLNLGEPKPDAEGEKKDEPKDERKVDDAEKNDGVEDKKDEPKADKEADKKDEPKDEPKDDKKTEDEEIPEEFKVTEEEAKGLKTNDEITAFLKKRIGRISDSKTQEKVAAAVKDRDEQIEKLTEQVHTFQLEALVSQYNLDDESKQMLVDTGKKGEDLIAYAKKYAPKMAQRAAGGEGDVVRDEKKQKNIMKEFFGDQQQQNASGSDTRTIDDIINGVSIKR